MATSPVNDDRYHFSVTKLLGIGFANSVDPQGKHGEPVLWNELERVAELNHRINNPLTAIRNAIYLAGRLTLEPEVLRYLELTDQEISSISRALEEARCAAGELLLRQRPATGKRAANPPLPNKLQASP